MTKEEKYEETLVWIADYIANLPEAQLAKEFSPLLTIFDKVKNTMKGYENE